MHIIHLLRRRFPKKAPVIIWILIIAAASALVIGIGLLVMR